MLGIHALSASLSLLLEIGMSEVERKILANAQHLMSAIQSRADLELLTQKNAQLQSGIVVFKHKTIANETLYSHLQANHVICAIRGAGIRFSAHFYNTKDNLDRALALIPYA